jgi:L,D-transpeptidase catalytic domain
MDRTMIDWKVNNILAGALLLSTVTACNYEENTALAQNKAIEYAPCHTCLLLVKNDRGRVNHLGNPIYKLEAYLNGTKYYSLDAVTGRAYTQNANRNLGGTEAPLPDGSYRISKQIVAGNIPEVGNTFIPIYPNFTTKRTDLGIHYDPSFDRDNGEDGTSGCIGLTAKEDRDKINSFILQYQPQKLIVNID